MDGAGGVLREMGQLEGEHQSRETWGEGLHLGARQTRSEEDSDEGPSVVGCRGLQESMVGPDPTSRRGETVLMGESGQGMRRQ